MGKPVTKYCVISRNSRCIISRCCAIVFMGAAILEQQEQLAYKESFPTTHKNYNSPVYKADSKMWKVDYTHNKISIT